MLATPSYFTSFLPSFHTTRTNSRALEYSLPCVTDPELLQIFSEGNTDHIETVGSDFLTFNTLAWVGDSLLQHHFRLRLSRLFGYVNHDLTRCIYPYAKGNEFLAIIGKHYSLDKWLKKFDYKDQKLWADVVEAWIGMVEIERDLWLYDERVGELEYWLEWLCLVRYGDTIRDLDSGVYLWGKNTTENVQLKHEKVLFSGGRIDTPERPSDKAKGYRVQARFPPRATTTFKDETGSEQRESLEDTDKKENIRRDEIEKEELVGRAFSRSLKFAQDLAREKLCARIFSYYIPELNLVKDQQKQTILSTSSSSHTISSPESLNNKSSSSSVPSTLSRSIFLEPFEQDPVSTLSRLSDFIHPNIFQQYQRKIFAAYMKLRADNDVNGDGDSIQLGKIFLDLEERYLIWINELEELKGEVAGVDIDKTRALLWWHLVSFIELAIHLQIFLLCFYKSHYPSFPFVLFHPSRLFYRVPQLQYTRVLIPLGLYRPS